MKLFLRIWLVLILLLAAFFGLAALYQAYWDRFRLWGHNAVMNLIQLVGPIPVVGFWLLLITAGFAWIFWFPFALFKSPEFPRRRNKAHKISWRDSRQSI